MSKSTSMLPTLAGGSGVPTHTLGDADLMKVVDSVTLNAYRDRKVTLAELAAYLGQQYTTYTTAEADYAQNGWRTVLTVSGLDPLYKYVVEGVVNVRNGIGETLAPQSVDVRVISGTTTYTTTYSGGIAQNADMPNATIQVTKTLITGVSTFNIDVFGIVSTGGGAKFKATPSILVSRAYA